MKCAICGREIKGNGNDLWPIRSTNEKGCDSCNFNFVLPFRFMIKASKRSPEEIDKMVQTLSTCNKQDLELMLALTKVEWIQQEDTSA